MSYILDALRKAEAERQRGAVPGLHDQPALRPGTDAGARAAGPPRGAWMAVALALALGAAAALGWALWRQPAGVPAAPAAAAGQGAAAPTAAPALPGPLAATGAPGAVAAPPAPAPTTVQLQIQVQPMPAAPAPAAPAPRAPAAAAPPAAVALPASPAPVVPGATVPGLPGPAAPLTAGAPAAPASPAPTAPAAVAAAAVDPAPPPARLPTLAELPESLRRALPPLSAGGGMYAEQVALRMVVLNGQVFHEGDRPAPELLVQQIRPRSVVLVFRGQRFELPM